MGDAARYIVPVMVLLIGGAAGALSGVVLLFVTDWSGDKLRGAFRACAALGALLGLAVTYGVPTTSLAFQNWLTPPSVQGEMERVLKAHYPDDYAHLETTVREMRASGASDDQMRTTVQQIGAPLVHRQMMLATTDNALAYLHILSQEQQALSADPEFCYRALVEEDSEALGELEHRLPADLVAREARLQVKLLEQTATQPQPLQVTPELKGKLGIWVGGVLNGLLPEERAALDADGPLHAKARCDLIGGLLRQLDQTGGSDGADAFKALIGPGVRVYVPPVRPGG